MLHRLHEITYAVSFGVVKFLATGL